MFFDFSIKNKLEIDENKIIDFLVIGGGPAGINGALYAKRKGLETLIVSKNIGGQLLNTSAVDNYLGFNNISGSELSNLFLNHIKDNDIKILDGLGVKSLIKDENLFYVTLDNNKVLKSKTILISTGGNPRKLDVPGEEKYLNNGVSYCTICDGPFFKDKKIIIAGGANAAVEAAIDMSKLSSEVILVQRSTIKADQVLVDRMNSISNIKVFTNTLIKEIIGNNKMSGIIAIQDNKEITIEANGIFVEIGLIPNSFLVENLVELNDKKEIIVNEFNETSLKGLYAAGDVTNEPYKQIIISASGGAKAAIAANNYLNQLK